MLLYMSYIFPIYFLYLRSDHVTEGGGRGGGGVTQVTILEV